MSDKLGRITDKKTMGRLTCKLSAFTEDSSGEITSLATLFAAELSRETFYLNRSMTNRGNGKCEK